MLRSSLIQSLFILHFLFASTTSYSQDSIYTIYKEVFSGKVTEVGPKHVKYVDAANLNGPIHILNIGIIDSIKYANGQVELIKAKVKRDLHENIPELNTWGIDFFGFALYTVSQSYERRLKNGIVGFRIPLYIAYRGGGIPDEGLFRPNKGTYGLANLYEVNTTKRGSSIATGLNVKCYLFKGRVFRVFAGPEATLGYSTLTTGADYIVNGVYYYSDTRINLGTFAAAGKVGITINPVDRLNISLDGGAGVGDVFGYRNPVGWTGIWQVGFAVGTNF